MKEVTVGAKLERKTTVIPEMLANNVGSGTLEVFSTPMLGALMENAAMSLLQGFLEEGETSVGGMLTITHEAPTPEGMEVMARAEIAAVNGREIAFSVEAFDEVGRIGVGAHKRVVVNGERFQAKAYARKNKE